MQPSSRGTWDRTKTARKRTETPQTSGYPDEPGPSSPNPFPEACFSPSGAEGRGTPDVKLEPPRPSHHREEAVEAGAVVGHKLREIGEILVGGFRELVV